MVALGSTPVRTASELGNGRFFKKVNFQKKKAEKLIFDSTFNQSLDTFHPPLSVPTQGQPGRPSWPKTCCSGLAETQAGQLVGSCDRLDQVNWQVDWQTGPGGLVPSLGGSHPLLCRQPAGWSRCHLDRERCLRRCFSLHSVPV